MSKRFNIGDYVRTKYGIIGKIVKEEPFMDTILIFLDNRQGNVTLQSKDGVFKVNHKEDIIKSSLNIIDLIEVGDYVNGREVRQVYDLGFGKCFCFKNEYGKHYDKTYKIKSIVTKEQFKSMQYKVGDKENDNNRS